MIYIDSSAWVKRYRSEDASEETRALMDGDAIWVTAAHTLIEVHRALSLEQDAGTAAAAATAFDQDIEATELIEVDRRLITEAIEVAVETRARTLNALHLAALLRLPQPRLLTFDRRMADAARNLDIEVVAV